MLAVISIYKCMLGTHNSYFYTFSTNVCITFIRVKENRQNNPNFYKNDVSVRVNAYQNQKDLEICCLQKQSNKIFYNLNVTCTHKLNHFFKSKLFNTIPYINVVTPRLTTDGF